MPPGNQTIRTSLRAVLPFLLWASTSPLAPVRGQTPDAAPARGDGPTVASVEAKIAEIESATDLEEEVKTKALEDYRNALSQLESARTFAVTLAGYEKLVEEGPKEIERIREELKTTRPTDGEPVAELADRPLNELEGELTREQARVAAAQGERTALAEKIIQQEKRPATIREELAKARDRLQQIEAELKLPPGDANVVLREARTTLLNARKIARTLETRMLEQELVIYQTRLELLTARRSLAERAVVQQEARAKELRELVDRRRRAEAERQRVEAEQAREATRGKNPALEDLADTNAKLSNEFAELTRRTEDASRTHQRILEDLKTVEEEHRSARTQLERVGLSAMLAEIFRAQRREVPDVAHYRQLTAKHREGIGAVKLAQLEVDKLRRELADPASTLRGLTTAASLEDDEREAFEAAARELLRDQIDLLGKVDTSYGRYLSLLRDLDFDQRQLAASVRDYRGFLDDHLLWTPSASLFGQETAKDLGASARWLMSPGNWTDSMHALRTGAVENPIATGLGLLAVVGLFFLSPGARRRIHRHADRIGRRHSDRFALTVASVLLSAVLAAPWALLVLVISWLLLSSTPVQDFHYALGAGLASVALPLFLLQYARVFCQPKGVAEAHFRWRQDTLTRIQRSAFWIMVLALPAAAITVLTEAFDNDAFRHSLGRVAFVSSMLAVSVITGRLLAPGAGVLRDATGIVGPHWLTSLRHVWFVLGAGLPFCIAALAAAGYYYTALQLLRRVLLSAAIIVAAVVLYQLILRWLFIARTRLAIARARERREAALASSDKASVESENLELEVPEIDLATVKQQTQRLFGTAIVLTVFVSLLATWAPVLPALAVLDRELWTVRSSVGGEDVIRSITIASVSLAVLIVALSFIAYRNLPGLLEIAILRRLSPDAGSRYAMSTIGQYALITLGLVLAFRTVGVAWSHVQWLVAALGVGLGFGLHEIVANFVSGLIILLERPIRVGDTVTIGEISGTVTRIRIRATTITDWDLKELVVPNKTFITGQLVNWSLSNPITRLTLRVGIAYGSDTERALQLMLEAARSNPDVLDEPESAVYFVGFGESALDFEVRAFVKELSNRARTRILHELHMGIDRLFRENDIVIAFPQRDIHIRSDERPGVPSARSAFETGLD